MLTKTKTVEQKRAYTAADITKESGIKSPAVVRRILRAAAITKPKGGWTWPDKAAAKDLPNGSRSLLANHRPFGKSFAKSAVRRLG